MSKQTFAIDSSGARGSNTGDEFHELWATRQALRLLDTTAGLTAMTVEGMTIKEGQDRVWDGVDCAAFYGGESAADAERVEIQQMKYSTANAHKPWTVARLAAGNDGKVTSSPIRRLGQAYKGLMHLRAGRLANSVRISLVTNQPVAQEVIDAISAARTDVPANYVNRWRKGGPNLHRLVYASGLAADEFHRFAEVLDLQEHSGSRFELEDEMLKAIAAWSDSEFVESAAQLRSYVRRRMMPEATGELITRERVLLQIGVSDGRTLFPCPSMIEEVEAPVRRAIAKTLANRIASGQQYICVHGAGGAGKTTLLQEVEKLLPPGSVMLKFDCYGAGSYQDASALRHRPQDVFIQLANELAQFLRLPMLTPPRATQDYPRLFRRRLDLAAATLAQVQPSALLVIAIDAADNSVTAAHSRTPPERSFVHDLMSFEGLPSNTHFLVSARTGRLVELALPSAFEKISLPPFDRSETGLNVSRFWTTAPEVWVDDIHHLSGGVPRVQAYAFETAEDNPKLAIDALRPVGKKLDQIFREQFQLALRKAGRSGEVQLLCAGLIALPRPIPVAELAAVLKMSTTQIVDLCSDLAPGVRLQADQINFADEDFEAFVREEAGSAVKGILERAADRLSAEATTNAYAALNVAPVLLAAGRGRALLDLAENQPEPPIAVMPDPVRRQEVLVQRLQAAIKACRDAGESARALRFVLIGADAKGTDHATRTLMIKYPGLTAKYAAETAGRVILGDPAAIQHHGPLLCRLIAEDAVRGDAISEREDRRRLNAWLSARWDTYQEKKKAQEHADAWAVSPDDFASIVYATIVSSGVDTALSRYSSLPANAFNTIVLRKLVARLLAEGKSDLVEELAAKLRPMHAIFVYVPLAIAGRSVNFQRLAEGLVILKRRFHLDAEWLRKANYNNKHQAAVIDIALTAAEILVAAKIPHQISDAVLASFRTPEVRRRGQVHDSDAALLDAILRSCTLADVIAGKQSTVESILLPRADPSEDKPNSRSNEARNDRRVEDVIRIVLDLYVLRAKTLSSGRPDDAFAETLIRAQKHFESERWRIENRLTALDIRIKASECLTVLLVTGADPAAILSTALELRGGWASHYGVAPTRLFERFAAVASLHPGLVQSLAQAAQKTRDARVGAEDKAQSLATFAQLLVTISPQDSEVVFKNAISAASDLDSEIVHRLRLIGDLLKRGLPEVDNQRQHCAQALSDVIHDAAVRLEHSEFCWSDAFTALARLDLSIALTAAARWSDTQRARLSDSLPPIITVGLDQRLLAVADSTALLGLIAKPSGDDLNAFIERAEQDGPAVAAQIAEEFGHDILVNRISAFDTLSAFVLRHGRGPATTRLAAQSRFLDAIDKPTQTDEQTAERVPPAAKSHDVLKAQVWAIEDLVDAHRLTDLVDDVTARSRAAKQYPTDEAVFAVARNAVPFSRRLDHLKALAGLRGRFSVAAPLLEALSDWSTQLAVRQWAIDMLPELIVERLPDFASYLPWEGKRLALAFSLAHSKADQIQALLLKGISRHADELGPTVTVALVGLIGAQLKPTEAAELAQWYIERLRGRIPASYLEGPPDAELPASISEALGRFLYAHLSDVDIRVRWRAAHSLRRLARVNRGETLAAIVAQAARESELAFRDPEAPFYAMAARLWLVIALDRIADETPVAAASHGEFLLRTALDDSFPHVLMRAYAADACHKLAGAGHLKLTAEDVARLATVNQSALPRSTEGNMRRTWGNHLASNPGARFHFDSMDTLPYWFGPWSDVFDGLTSDEFQQEAERWIVDEWHIQDAPPYGSSEPRKRRFHDRNYSLASHRHGSEPVMELHRRYLEWHAMWCTVGTLLATHRLTPIEEWGEDPFSSRLDRSKLTIPPVWLADLAGPTPLEVRYWREDSAPGAAWLQGVKSAEFSRELRASDHPGYLVIFAYSDARWMTFEQSSRVSTGLVSPETAHALVRALQSYDNPSDYYICPEGHDCEIEDGDFVLKGWLKNFDLDSGFDDADVYRNGVRRIERSPGTALTTALALERRLSPIIGWWRPGIDQPALIYEEWGEPERDERPPHSYGSAVTSRGHRLLIREEDLQIFLVSQGLDLIAEVGIERRDRRDGSSAFDEESTQGATFDRVLLLRSDGRLQGAERDLGTWRTDCSGASRERPS